MEELIVAVASPFAMKTPPAYCPLESMNSVSMTVVLVVLSETIVEKRMVRGSINGFMSGAIVFPPFSQAKNSERQWIASYQNMIALIHTFDITSANFADSSRFVVSIRQELIEESRKNTGGTTTPLYNRNNFIVKEVVRQGKLYGLVSTLRQSAKMLNDGSLVFNNDTVTINERPIGSIPANAIFRDIPSIVALCFAAPEAISIVNIEEVVGFIKDIVVYVEKNNLGPLSDNTVPYTLFTCPIRMFIRCMESTLAINGPDFFSLIGEANIIWDLVKIAQPDRKDVIEAIGMYISSPLGAEDIEALTSDESFVEDYEEMIETRLKPIQTTERSLMRPLLSFYRSLTK